MKYLLDGDAGAHTRGRQARSASFVPATALARSLALSTVEGVPDRSGGVPGHSPGCDPPFAVAS
jgi:hypothetical protein